MNKTVNKIGNVATYLGSAYAITKIIIFAKPEWVEIENEILALVNVGLVGLKMVADKWFKLGE